MRASVTCCAGPMEPAERAAAEELLRTRARSSRALLVGGDLLAEQRWPPRAQPQRLHVLGRHLRPSSKRGSPSLVFVDPGGNWS